MSERKRLLQMNPAPIKLVPAGVRDVWTRLPGWRCDHEDGRGRCTSRETRPYWNAAERIAEHFCERHDPRATNSQPHDGETT